MKAKFVNETAISKYDRAYIITTKQLDKNPKNLRWLGDIVIPGLYSTLFENYGLGRSDEVVRGMKDAIFDFICEEINGGFEATFASDEAYEWWEGLDDSYFEQGPDRENMWHKMEKAEIELIKKPPKSIFEE